MINKKIFITRKIPEYVTTALQKKGCTVVVYEKNKPMNTKVLIKHLQKNTYDAVICLLTDRITAEVFDAAPSVRLYVNYATGFDNIDIPAAHARSIAVANAPTNASSQAVAQHTIALLLALTNRIVEADTFTKNGKYQGWEPLAFLGTSIANKEFGLIGAGRIGVQVAQYARGLGFSVRYYDTIRQSELEESCNAIRVESLEQLLSTADVLSLHVPLTAQTKHLIDTKAFSFMKPTSFLINTARGPVVQEEALIEALKAKKIAGAALDVFEYEPIIAKALRKMSSVILTPHIASATVEAREEMAHSVVETVIDFFEGNNPRTLLL